MVIYYRDKFIKAFLGSLILFAVLIFLVLNIIWFIENSEKLPFLPKFTYILVPLTLVTLALAAYGLHFYSIYLLLKAKGYSGWLTFLGLINIFGFAIVVLLPDKRKSNNF